MPLPDTPDLEQTLRERFGLERFRPGQREVIEEVIRGRDVLCVMPTGGGKSLCYQLPALVLPGLTLVVSPLIALMKDQVDALRQRGIRATLINSTLDPSEQLARIHEIEAGQYDLVYVAPERFRSGRFVAAMGKARPTLLAIDEAHCISEWGHDFRPDYARIGHARRVLGSPRCIALTATATDLVRRDIADQLDLKDPAIFVTGFDRPNLVYGVVKASRDLEKLSALAKILDENPGSAIVYASSRARCQMVAEHVTRELRKQAVVYHAGLSRDDRTRAQERFMEGEAEVVVATNAFGMGVDKADIRAVVHYNMPGTLEAYYQEAGRAGRDGLPAECVLLYAPGDRVLQELFIDNEYPPPDLVFRVYNFLRALDDDPIERTQVEIKAEAGIELNESAVGTALKLLEGAGAIERFLPRENMAIVRINADGEDDPGSLAGRLSPQANVQRIVLLGLEGLVNRRYSEPVYFQPDDFAAALGLDRPALVRALKALSSDLPIDYVPPFRGHAICVTDRKRKPRDLGIDFATLNKRKEREYDKLERMIKYSTADRCRRSFILGYFGDATAEAVHCGRCDNCIAAAGPDSARRQVVIDTPAGREVILKALSGVARVKGRFGKTVVAQMLKGSGAEKMDSSGLRNLSTFGILASFTQAELVQILDALTAAGFVEAPEVDRFRPIVTLADAGWELLKSKAPSPLVLAVPDHLAAKIRKGGQERLAGLQGPTNVVIDGNEPSEVATSSAGDPLFETLKAMRTAWAREVNQPAYCVFSNQTLESLVRDRPRTPHELAAVKGFGPARLERYGAAVLGAIAESLPPTEREVSITTGPPPERADGLFADRSDCVGLKGLSTDFEEATPRPQELPETSPTRPPAPPKRSAYVPTEEWTWRLLEKGFTLDDVAAIRGLDRAAVVRHAALVARQGKPVAVEAFLDGLTAARWHSWRVEHGDAAPPPDDAQRSDVWALFVACRSARHAGS